MTDLLRTKCAQGTLIITENQIKIEGRKAQTLQRASFTGIDSQQTVPAVFGRGGAMTLTFHGPGVVIQATMVPLSDAKKILQLLS